MKLEKTESIDSNCLKDILFDAFICCSGYESRCNYIARNYAINARRYIALGFDNFRTNGYRNTSDNFYNKRKYDFFISEADSGTNIIKILGEIFENIQDEVNLLVDYSSMSRIWYSTIISYLKLHEYKSKISVYFIYSYSNFSYPSNEIKRNIHIGPIDNYSSLSIPDKPTALIIGLGHEKERAFGLTEYLDAETYLFYNDSFRNQKYYNSVINANKRLLQETKEENKFEYSVYDLEGTESLLFSLCKSLIDDYRIILAPTGPKPFTLICLLMSLRIPNLDVWRISAGNERVPVNSTPSGEVSCFKSSFSN